MNDIMYPIYSIEATWVEDGKHDPECEWRNHGLPEGRVHNRSSFSKMFREEPGLDAVIEFGRNEWWPNYVIADKWSMGPVAARNPTDIEITAKLVIHESWCCTWFSHYTFDVGQTDAEALDSFQ